MRLLQAGGDPLVGGDVDNEAVERRCPGAGGAPPEAGHQAAQPGHLGVGESDAGLFSISRRAFLVDLPAYAARVELGTSSGERTLLPFIPAAAAAGLLWHDVGSAGN